MREIIDHRRLDCGLELAVLPMPRRPLVALDIRIYAGFAFEPPARLGLCHVLDEAISKGTARYNGRGLNDAFDAIGAAHWTHPGRELMRFAGLCLPEHFGRLVELHAEMIRTPAFPEDACRVAVELTRQALDALADDPGELARKLLHRRAYAPPLNRHVLGEIDTLAGIRREHLVDHWRRCFTAPRMLAAVAGAVEASSAADVLERAFEGFAGDDPATKGARPGFTLDLRPGYEHYPKDAEQTHVIMCFPGAAATDPDFPVEQVTLGVLDGGMSGRLFTEVREKQGLVYWVGAWSDQPSRGGAVHLGASTTPENLERTCATLLGEVDRLERDLSEAEVRRAITGIVARARTRGDVTQARASRLADDLFFYGRPIPLEEKIARVEAVTVEDVRAYLLRRPRDVLAAVTVGPAGLKNGLPRP